MSMKKKLGSKLSEGVRQVKSQREPGAAVTPPKTAPVAKPAAKPMPASAATKPTASSAVTQAKTKLIKLRVWPD